jgi:hypothetical protein
MSKLVETPPDPSNEIQMLSRIGYTLESAISDIIDNSISANSKSIRIDSFPSGNEKIFWSILDDGHGMNPEELQENMRIGCKDPTKEREKMDLGRFGSGLKTASISQAKKITVFSKTANSKLSAARWDVDNVCDKKKWLLEVFLHQEIEKILPESLRLKTKSGTCVLWEEIPRYIEKDHTDISALQAEDIVRVKKHISKHFHKFMGGSYKIKFYVNGEKLSPIDPFMSNLKGYIEGPKTKPFKVKGGTVSIKVHNIPHWDKLNSDQIDEYGGQSEISKKQGLYIYRADRLIIEGGWLGLTNNSQLGNLSRIEINIPVSMDGEWQTDVKKSSLQLPPKVKIKLRELIKIPIKKSKRTYKYKGKKEENNLFWSKVNDERKNIITYEINDENKELINLVKSLKKEKKVISLLSSYLTKLSSNLPLNDIYYTMADKPLDIKQEHLEKKFGNDSQLLKDIIGKINKKYNGKNK